MPSMGPNYLKTLRDYLRDNTASDHDTLDEAVSAINLADRRSYADFLRFQYAARAPIEDWLAARAPDLELPAMAPLIARDLAAMGEPLPGAERFTFPAANGAIGIAWALAGSHLGNRALLIRMRKSGADRFPTAFLGDETMRAAWQALLPQLEAPADRLECAQAATAASAVFRHFGAALDQTLNCAERVAA